MFCDICQIDNIDIAIGMINKITLNRCRYLIKDNMQSLYFVDLCLLTLKKVIVIVKSPSYFLIFARRCKFMKNVNLEKKQTLYHF